MLNVEYELSEKISDFLHAANISSCDDSWDVRHKLVSVGFFKEDTDYYLGDGASKICIVFNNLPFVIKWSHGYYDDEAMEEVTIYKDAKEKRLDKFFPETALFERINNINFVIQEKIDMSVYDLNGRDSYEKLKQKMTSISRNVPAMLVRKIRDDLNKDTGSCSRQIDSLWIQMSVILYGKRAVRALCDFTTLHKINDLHACNVGYLNNRPVILDFSGYHRDD